MEALPTLKRCSKCGQEKPLTEFCADKKGKGGKNARCRPCKGVRDAAYRAAHRGRIKERDGAYRARNRDRIRERDAAWGAVNREKKQADGLKRRHNMTPQDKADLFEAQGGRCKCCGVLFTSLDEAFVEHCHSYLVRRGLVHNICNFLIALREKYKAKLFMQICRGADAFVTDYDNFIEPTNLQTPTANTMIDIQDFTLAFNDMQDNVHQTAVSKGWWDKDREDGTLIALIHSELSEHLNGLRLGNKPDEHCPQFSNAEIELADTVIRLMDYAAKRGHRLAGAIVAKAAYNITRPHMHGGKKF